MRPALAILLAALSATIFLPSGQQPAVASCAGPYLTDVDHIVLHRGAGVDINGAGFVDGCQDTGSCTNTLGCTSCDYGPEPTPMSDITLSLRQHGHTWPLGTADARRTNDDSGAVTWTVAVPTDVKIGEATLVPKNGEPAKIRVR